MRNGNLELMNRRNVLSLLGAAGIFGIAGWRGFGQGRPSQDVVGSNAVKGPDSKEKFKTIGVLGGLGPQATMDFEAKVHRAAQRLIPSHQNSGYPPMVVYYYRHPPILLNADNSPKIPITPDPRILDVAKRIGIHADFLVVPSNGAHMLQGLIERSAGRMVLSMIEATIAEIRRRGWKKVGVLGFGEPTVYFQPLRSLNVIYETIDVNLGARLDDVVMKVMEGREDEASASVALEAVDALRARKLDGIILGCTEIPLLLGKNAVSDDLLNPAELLAEAAVNYAIS
jgi:aspartate racemase